MIEPFPVRDVGERTWGREILIAHTTDYLGKVLLMRAGAMGGLQLHRQKDETFHLYSGEAFVDYDLDGQLTRVRMMPGQSYHIPPGAPHRVEAITDCVFFECSTPVFEDRVRLESKYGLPDTGGLPTTESTP